MFINIYYTALFKMVGQIKNRCEPMNPKLGGNSQFSPWLLRRLVLTELNSCVQDVLLKARVEMQKLPRAGPGQIFGGETRGLCGRPGI